jgi:hypothetical protein
MSGNVEDHGGAKVAAAELDSATWLKSYAYLRTAMVLLLLGLGAAVIFQSVNQHSVLSSVSAYYYTPAQGIFVGALIGLGACMIALKGTTGVEEVFLNLGGMFAAVVAIVPTARGVDQQTALQRACEKEADSPLLTEKVATGLDCPSPDALADATRANVENNLVALLVVGGLALVAAWYFARRNWRSDDRIDSQTARTWSIIGFIFAAVVWVAGLLALLTAIEWFVSSAHYVAAIGLFVCIFVVAAANSRRRRDERRAAERDSNDQPIRVNAEQSHTAPGRQPVRQAYMGLKRYRYRWIALAMLIVAGVGAGLLWQEIITLFLFELVVALLFAVFWFVQTIEQLPQPAQPVPGRRQTPKPRQSPPDQPLQGAAADEHP